MLSEFYVEGGWGMHPVTLFGFLLVAASVAALLKPESQYRRLLAPLGVATLGAGLLGTATGICASAHYLAKVEPSKQVEIFALGIQESLHNLVLSLILIVVASLIAAVTVLKSPRAAGFASAGG